METTAFAILAAVVGFTLGRTVFAPRGTRGDDDGTHRVHEQGRGSISMIPGAGWRAAVMMITEESSDRFWAATEKYHAQGGDPDAIPDFEERIERLEVIGWELHHEVTSEALGVSDGEPREVLVSRTNLLAHCMHNSRQYTQVIDGNSVEATRDGFIQYLAPGEDFADEELARRHERQQARWRERTSAPGERELQGAKPSTGR